MSRNAQMKRVASQRRKVLDGDALNEAAACLKVLSNPQRLGIVQFLLDGPQRVGEIAISLDLLPHVTSEHLKLLERCGFVKGTRNGKTVSYEIVEPHLEKLFSCLKGRFAGV